MLLIFIFAIGLTISDPGSKSLKNEIRFYISDIIQDYLIINTTVYILQKRKDTQMIKKYVYGNPFPTDAVILDMDNCTETISYFSTQGSSLNMAYQMNPATIVYGLGESNRGINKRGYLYHSFCSDTPSHTPDLSSMYGAHNFLIISGNDNFGVFIDCPEKIEFDIGYSDYNELKITSDACDYTIYIIEEIDLKSILRNFRKLIGESYIPPKWAFGYQQSRWGYAKESDFYEIAAQYRQLDIPLESIYMDIDYMEEYKDFTIDREKFPDFEELVCNLKKDGIRLVPIIDAGVKIEKDYSIYEEGIENNYFCENKSGNPFVAAVWPGRVHFPDFLNSDARSWFGEKYRLLTDAGIEGFWNDMNEPAIFYSEEGLKEAFEYLDSIRDKNIGIKESFGMKDAIDSLSNNPKDYERFFHNVDGQKFVHTKLHNLYGYMMTRSASEGLKHIDPDKRFLLFSRASYIGMHRYGGIWTGDNSSWWEHLLLNIKMMPSLNMCGFLYSGADLGGFGSDTTYDLMVRWLQFGLFTPLMRNHSALDTREQELYQFSSTQYFSKLLKFRYQLLPYLYSEFVKAAKNNEMFFLPLAFEHPQDFLTKSIEDQLFVGDSLMVTPIYTQNATGRYIYLPEDMLMIKFDIHMNKTFEVLYAGHHYLPIALEEFVLFVRKNKLLILAKDANNTFSLDTNTLEIIGFADETDLLCYNYYDDDGETVNIDLSTLSNITVCRKNSEWVATTNSPSLHFHKVTIIDK